MAQTGNHTSPCYGSPTESNTPVVCTLPSPSAEFTAPTERQRLRRTHCGIQRMQSAVGQRFKGGSFQKPSRERRVVGRGGGRECWVDRAPRVGAGAVGVSHACHKCGWVTSTWAGELLPHLENFPVSSSEQ